MKRTESLARLAENAEYARGGCWPARIMPDHRAFDAARAHGLAAVAAVRESGTCACTLTASPYQHGRVTNSARLAVRAALAACGLKVL